MADGWRRGEEGMTSRSEFAKYGNSHESAPASSLANAANKEIGRAHV